MRACATYPIAAGSATGTRLRSSSARSRSARAFSIDAATRAFGSPIALIGQLHFPSSPAPQSPAPQLPSSQSQLPQFPSSPAPQFHFAALAGCPLNWRRAPANVRCCAAEMTGRLQAQILDAARDHPRHQRARHPFVIGGNHPPWRPVRARVPEHVLKRLLVLVPVVPFFQIRTRELPVLVRVVESFEETALLFLLGKVQKEFQDQRPLRSRCRSNRLMSSKRSSQKLLSPFSRGSLQ